MVLFHVSCFPDAEDRIFTYPYDKEQGGDYITTAYRFYLDKKNMFIKFVKSSIF